MKRINYWYSAQPNEIFCDLDSKRALTRALHVIRRAMQQHRNGKRHEEKHANGLSVKDVFVYPTGRKNHFHMIVVLHQPLPAELRAMWALWMASDRLRAVYVMERIRRLSSWRTLASWMLDNREVAPQQNADLLVSSRRYHRLPNQTCSCTQKHKSDAVNANCEALQALLGTHATADYFPRNVDRKTRGPVRFGFGRISKTSILRWKP